MATNTTATTQNHNGTGSQNNFAISFAFLANTEVDVKVGGVLKTLGTHYNIVGSEVQFTSGNTPPSGTANIVFTRDTDISAKKVDFADGSVLTETDLDNNSDQILFAQQEFTNDYVKRDGSQTITGNLVFEGATDDGNETTLAITDPTADRTITVPDITGTLITTGDTGTVSTQMVANDAITNAKLANDSVHGDNIIDGTIQTNDLAADAITSAKLADNAVNSEHYVDGSIDHVHLANDIIEADNIVDDAIRNEHLSNPCVQTENINDSAITTIKIANDAITNDKLANDSVHGDNIIDGTIQRNDLAADIIDSSKLADDAIRNEHLSNPCVQTENINDDAVTIAKIADAVIVTNSEQASHSVDDNTFFTTSAAEARYFNASTGETIKDGQTFPDNDTTIATTAAINDRIIDLVDDVGGFVPIANETSFPTSNPDVNNGTGTIVSVSAASTDLTPSGTTVTIANGRGSGLAVIITGVSSTIPSGFGFLVETTTTAHTYTFHRLSPNATQVSTVAGKATEIGRLGTADAVADMAILGTADVVADMNLLGTTDVVADMNLLATSDVIADMALLAVPDVISDMNDLATSGNITAMSNCSTSISSINNASSNLSSINNFGDKYQIAANDPSTDGGGNALAAGDLYFNTSANELKIYNGSAWQGGVTASGNFASITGNTFTGDNRYNDSVKLKLGTGSDLEIYHDGSNSIINDAGTGSLRIAHGGSNHWEFGDSFLKGNDNRKIILGDSSDLQIYHDGSDSYIKDTGTGDLKIFTNNFDLRNAAGTETLIDAFENGAVELYYDNSKKFETLSNGNRNTGYLSFLDGSTNAILMGNGNDLQIYHDGTNSIIDNTTGELRIQTDGAMRLMSTGLAITDENNSDTIINAQADGQVGLYYDNSLKLETTSGGLSITGTVLPSANNTHSLGSHTASWAGLHLGDHAEARFGNLAGGDLKIYHDATFNRIASDVRTDFIKITGSEHLAKFIPDGAVELYFDNNKKFNTLADGVHVHGQIQLNDNGKLNIGDSDDLQIYHDGTDSYIASLVTGNVYHRARRSWYLGTNATSGGSDKAIHAIENGAVELYYDDVKQVQTTADGVGFINNCTFSDNKKIQMGASNDLQLYHDGSNSAVYHGGAGNLLLLADTGVIEIAKTNNFEKMIVANPDGGVELYFDASKKLETVTGGVYVYGDLGWGVGTTGNLFCGDNSKLILGTGNDLQIFHDGTNSIIRSDNTKFQNTSGTEIGQLVFAWFNVDPTGSSSIQDSFNVSSVTENNENTYTMAFARAAANANYATAIDVETETNHFTGAHTTSGFVFRTGGNLGGQNFSAVIFGD